jgi:hypothetical protein
MRVLTALSAAFLVLAGAGLAEEPYGDISDLKLAKPEDKEDVKGTPPPPGAVVLFDGKGFDAWARRNGAGEVAWKLVEGGAMEVRRGGGDIVTRQKTDKPFRLHVEFRVPYMPKARGQARGTSGVYLQGRYEVQVLDSYGLDGKKVAPARITVYHNGVKIHDDVKIPVDSTVGGMGGDPCSPGPIVLLQDHGNPVQFRNIWMQPIR